MQEVYLASQNSPTQTVWVHFVAELVRDDAGGQLNDKYIGVLMAGKGDVGEEIVNVRPAYGMLPCRLCNS